MGNIEIWKDVVGYEGLYKVSDLGNIKSLSRIKKAIKGDGVMIVKEKILKPVNNGNNYFKIALCKGGIATQFLISRVVAIAFIPNPENKPEVNHKGINGNKADNRVCSLEWNTHKENVQHAFDNKLNIAPKGEKNGLSKLTDAQVLEIRSLTHINQREIAEIYNVHKSIISLIKSRKIWKHI